MTIIAATDGSALGNPGPAGWAWYIDENAWSAGALERSTNNVGELLAVLDLLRQTSNTGEDVHIFADSQYVINALTKWRFGWKKKGWKKADGKPVANREIIEALDEQLNRARGEGRRIEFEWVRGHNDHNLNEHADTHARAAATAVRDGKPVQQGPGFNAGEAASATRRSPESGEAAQSADRAARTQVAEPAPAHSAPARTARDNTAQESASKTPPNSPQAARPLQAARRSATRSPQTQTGASNPSQPQTASRPSGSTTYTEQDALF